MRAARLTLPVLALGLGCGGGIPLESVPSDPIAFVRQGPTQGGLSLDTFRKGLQIRAFEQLVLFVRPSHDKKRPIYLLVQAVGPNADVRMWSGGKLRFEGRRRLNLQAELVWDEEWDRYRFRSNVG